MNHTIQLLGSCFILVTVVVHACKKEDENDTPKVTSYEAKYARRTSVECGGTICTPDSRPIFAYGMCWNTSGSPTLADSFSFKSDWFPADSFSTTIQGLTPNTTYYIRAYASNEAGTGYGEVRKFTTLPAGATIVFNNDLTYGAVTDIDGNVYKTIDLGTQTWMAENLRTTRYNDNTEIPLVSGNHEWEQLTSPAYCWYENNEEIYKDLYGGYYNGYAVLTGKLCPSGWHVPSDEEWHTLETYLGVPEGSYSTVEGLKIKETGNHNWYPEDNINGTNESGFTGLPGGFRMGYDGGNIGAEGYVAFWWASDGYPQYGSIFDRWLLYSHSDLIRDTRILATGLNVRCIKD